MIRAFAAGSLLIFLLFLGHRLCDAVAALLSFPANATFLAVLGTFIWIWATRSVVSELPAKLRTPVLWPLIALITLPASLRKASRRLQQSGPKSKGGAPALRHFIWLLDAGSGWLESALEFFSPTLPTSDEERLGLVPDIVEKPRGLAASLALLGPLPPRRRARLLARARVLGWSEPQSLSQWVEKEDRSRHLFRRQGLREVATVAAGVSLGVVVLLGRGLWAAPLVGAGVAWLLSRLYYWWPATEPHTDLQEAARSSLHRQRPVAIEMEGRCEKLGQTAGIRVGSSWVETRPPVQFEGEGRVFGYLEGGRAICWWRSLQTGSGSRRAFPRLKSLVSPLFVCLLGGCWAVLQWVEM